MFVGWLLSFWWFVMICALHICVWSYFVMMYGVVFLVFVFVTCLVLCIFVYMCRVVLIRYELSCFFDCLLLFKWICMYACSFSKSFQVRSTIKLLISLNVIRVRQNLIIWMKHYMVFCVFYQKLMNMEYKDSSSYWFVCFSMIKKHKNLVKFEEIKCVFKFLPWVSGAPLRRFISWVPLNI